MQNEKLGTFDKYMQVYTSIHCISIKVHYSVNICTKKIIEIIAMVTNL